MDAVKKQSSNAPHVLLLRAGTYSPMLGNVCVTRVTRSDLVDTRSCQLKMCHVFGNFDEPGTRNLDCFTGDVQAGQNLGCRRADHKEYESICDSQPLATRVASRNPGHASRLATCD